MSGLQAVSRRVAGELQHLVLPPENETVLPGVRWGRVDWIGTPAFWKAQAWLHFGDPEDVDFAGVLRLGTTFREEVAGCLLGGYGIPAEIGLAAFSAIKSSGLLQIAEPTPDQVFKVLQRPLQIGNGQLVHYRFARQKSTYLSRALSSISEDDTSGFEASLDDCTLREWLLSFTGIGLKTASWIVRNWRNSNQIAVIDLHLHRAGIAMGLFGPSTSPSKQYYLLEARYLGFAQALAVHPALLDVIIWRQMKILGRHLYGGRVLYPVQHPSE